MGEKVTPQEAEEIVTEQLAGGLQKKGFRKTTHFLIVAPWGEAQAQVRIGARKDADSQKLYVGLMAGLRFQQLERILGRAEGSQDNPTITVPLHYLHEPRKLIEWQIPSPDLVAVMASEVDMYMIPFFEKYHLLDNVLSSLQSASPRDWFTLPPDGRIEVMAAILVVRKNCKQALELLDREIAIRRDTPSERRLRKVNAVISHHCDASGQAH